MLATLVNLPLAACSQLPLQTYPLFDSEKFGKSLNEGGTGMPLRRSARPLASPQCSTRSFTISQRYFTTPRRCGEIVGAGRPRT
ncbi:hypothetical protein BCV69DRAFT_283300 [Microstroma glucosiphilum]|uniref:Uncharacterized protein n=1 Tax=Pseudomicrostroma glucosiphilum TaxID=1684307 RepID=A0A316U5E5_9BASI|nr:hypothetical protein BCV69DRAFT_283300 [Pseudomicrostroma glucosiphilum]PWN20420.1 hypothetical protein BCV69DRAFT_283300 [Pseudomicrostroma glucosiphilum]